MIMEWNMTVNYLDHLLRVDLFFKKFSNPFNETKVRVLKRAASVSFESTQPTRLKLLLSSSSRGLYVTQLLPGKTVILRRLLSLKNH